ncbi:MAG TPA: hypothetical protein VIV27_06485 [Halioglobus sp.]
MLFRASRRSMLILTLVALPLLVGSKCVFIFSSGGGSSHKGDDKNDKPKETMQTAAVSSGHFGAPPVEGVSFESGSHAGVTGRNGEFQFEPGGTVRFFIGDIELGQAANAKSVMTARDLVADSASDAPAVVNISRLLLSLDAEPNDGVITIPESVRTSAIRSDAGVSSAIEFLDFSDDPAFTNAASQLVAVLTDDYPFTAMLVDADYAHNKMIKSSATRPGQ